MTRQKGLKSENTECPLVFIDTSHSGFQERSESDNAGEGSKFNDGEASIVHRHVQELIAAGVNELDIAIISPYNAQVALLNSILKVVYPLIEIGSIDGFQGH